VCARARVRLCTGGHERKGNISDCSPRRGRQRRRHVASIRGWNIAYTRDISPPFNHYTFITRRNEHFCSRAHSLGACTSATLRFHRINLLSLSLSLSFSVPRIRIREFLRLLRGEQTRGEAPVCLRRRDQIFYDASYARACASLTHVRVHLDTSVRPEYTYCLAFRKIVAVVLEFIFGDERQLHFPSKI
jgi:hypothetical protein